MRIYVNDCGEYVDGVYNALSEMFVYITDKGRTMKKPVITEFNQKFVMYNRKFRVMVSLTN